MSRTMKNNTEITSVSLTPNPIATGEAFLADVNASHKSKWGEYSQDRWQSVAGLMWG